MLHKKVREEGAADASYAADVHVQANAGEEREEVFHLQHRSK